MQPCPRQSEATLGSQLSHDSHWRADGSCSYCGSISAEALFEAIEKGYELGPTDKNYKVYVTRPDPHVGESRISGSTNFEKDGWLEVTADNVDSLPKGGLRAEIGHWVLIEPTAATKQDKFYFQHLTVDERKRFVDLLNAKVLNVGYPGRFYRLPFFCVREHAESRS